MLPVNSGGHSDLLVSAPVVFFYETTTKEPHVTKIFFSVSSEFLFVFVFVFYMERFFFFFERKQSTFAAQGNKE